MLIHSALHLFLTDFITNAIKSIMLFGQSQMVEKDLIMKNVTNMREKNSKFGW